MLIPKRIDDRLKDAIVSVQFLPGVPSEAVIGYIYQLLIPFLKNIVPLRNPLFKIGAPDLSVEPRPFYLLTKDERFRIDINEQSINFNLVNGYAGWKEYKSVIETCIKPLFEAEAIKQVQRIGVRYISQFDQIRIFDHINAVIDVSIAPTNSRGQLRFEFWQGEFQAVLTLLNGYPYVPNIYEQLDSRFFSLIDLDVIKFFNPNQITSYSDLLSLLEDAHTQEKKLFFSLLRKDFLDTLNPIY